jgi:FkbM family methyltransferase
MKCETVGGTMVYRDEYDAEVIKEVIDRQEYFRWGDITIKPGDLVVDAGAHIGSFTRLALSMGAEVIAIEPHLGNFDYLMANTEGAERVKLINGVLWNGSDVAFLSDKVRNELHKVSEKGKLMPSISLDEIVDKFGIKSIDLLKMDIEGAEYEVLRHFENLKLVKQITMEWHYGARSLAELIYFLDDAGFIVTWLGGNGSWGKLQCKRGLK